MQSAGITYIYTCEEQDGDFPVMPNPSERNSWGTQASEHWEKYYTEFSFSSLF